MSINVVIFLLISLPGLLFAWLNEPIKQDGIRLAFLSRQKVILSYSLSL